MSKCTFAVSLILAFSVFAFSQTKSISDAEAEIKTFQNFSNFSVAYEDGKDLTTAKISLDLRQNVEALRKPFKKFDWEISSIYSGTAIDDKPVRNILCINTQSKKPVFASSNALTILLGGEEINFGEPNRLSEVKGGKVKENLCWDINQEIITDFARADNINYQVGTIKSSIPVNLLQILRDYAKLLST